LIQLLHSVFVEIRETLYFQHTFSL